MTPDGKRERAPFAPARICVCLRFMWIPLAATIPEALTWSAHLTIRDNFRNFLMSEECAEMAGMVANLAREYRFEIAVLLRLTRKMSCWNLRSTAHSDSHIGFSRIGCSVRQLPRNHDCDINPIDIPDLYSHEEANLCNC